MKKDYRWLLFDADNTLLDFAATERQALRRSMERRGVPFSDAGMRVYLDINRPLWAAHYRGELSREALMLRRFADFAQALGIAADPAEWNREYLDLLGDCGDVIPGAPALLRALKPGRTVALATNGVACIQRRRLKDNPIVPFLDGIFISEEMGIGKPEKGYFDRVLAALGAKREQTVMVGDDLDSDIQGAINAGIDSIWYSPKGGESPLPTYTVRNYRELWNVIVEGGK